VVEKVAKELAVASGEEVVQDAMPAVPESEVKTEEPPVKE
jgi:hypothetical protein